MFGGSPRADFEHAEVAVFRGDAVRLSPAVVWFALVGWLAFGEVPNGWTVAGALRIAGSSLYIVRRE